MIRGQKWKKDSLVVTANNIMSTDILDHPSNIISLFNKTRQDNLFKIAQHINRILTYVIFASIFLQVTIK